MSERKRASRLYQEGQESCLKHRQQKRRRSCAISPTQRGGRRIFALRKRRGQTRCSAIPLQSDCAASTAQILPTLCPTVTSMPGRGSRGPICSTISSPKSYSREIGRAHV